MSRGVFSAEDVLKLKLTKHHLTRPNLTIASVVTRPVTNTAYYMFLHLCWKSDSRLDKLSVGYYENISSEQVG